MDKMLETIRRVLTTAFSVRKEDISAFVYRDYISSQYKAGAAVLLGKKTSCWDAYGETEVKALKKLSSKIKKDLLREIRQREKARKLFSK